MTILAIAVLIFASFLTIELEEGATFDGGICWEADGTEGISHYDGQCVTPADYDAMYSYENLSTVVALASATTSYPDDATIAEIYGITPEDDPASDRPIGVGLVEPGEERTFKERVRAAHLPLAI